MISVPNHQQPLSGSKLIALIFLVFIFSCSPKTRVIVNKEDEKKKDDTEVVNNELDAEARRTKEIALLLPLNLSNLNPSTLNSISSFNRVATPLDFYQGFRMGLDSLQKEGYKLRVSVFDTKDDTNEIVRLAKLPEVRKSDLVIGPIYPKEINAFNVISKNEKMYFISPLSPQLPAVNNPYFIATNATLEAHAEFASNFMVEKWKPTKILFVKSTNRNEDRYFQAFRNGLKKLNQQVTIVETGTTNLKSNLIRNGKNILVVASVERAFWNTVFNNLEGTPGDFYVIAHPNFENIENINLEMAQKYNVHFTSSHFLDMQNAGVKKFWAGYLKRYGTEPSEFAVKGFDIAYQFGKLLALEGKNYPKYMDKLFKSIHNDLMFEQTEQGFLNKRLNVLRVQDFQFVEQ